MKIRTTLLAAAMLCMCSYASADLVQSWEFTADNDTLGFVSTVTGSGINGLDTSGGFLTGTATGNDPHLLNNGVSLTPAAGETWDRIELRIREVRGAPHGSTASKGAEPMTADNLDFDQIGLVVGNASGTPATISGTPAGTLFVGSALDADGYSTVTIDISNFGSSTIPNFRIDPAGGAWSNSNSQTDGNAFSIDYIRIYDTAAIPEPASLTLIAVVGVGAIARRKRIA